MIIQLSTNLGEMADALVRAFLLPGELLLALLARIAPDTVALLMFGNGAAVVPFITALIVWTLTAIGGLLLLRFCKTVMRQSSAIVLTFWYRARMAFAGLVMRVTWKLRALLPRRRTRVDATSTPMIEFDDLDMAVLRTVSAQGPGFTLSAPDLAEKFTMRPSQVQRSLDKLSSNRLLACAIGSTDGYDNYSMTDSGLAFMAMLQRQQARG